LPENQRVRIIEAYRGYVPPPNVVKVVRRLLEVVPEKYCRGLDCIVLDNFAGLSRHQRMGSHISPKRKLAKSSALGFYRQEWKGTPASIVLHVDTILQSAKQSKLPLWLPIARDFWFGAVLYHELGHHIHQVMKPEFREREDVADSWRGKLLGNWLRKRYWYALPIVIPIYKVYKLIKKRSARHD
jgi:hypothetical protein